jgi:hypothetical protein
LQYEDGQPAKELSGFRVLFTPVAAGKSAGAEILQDGSFRLRTEGIGDGAFAGKYRVTLTQPHPDPERGERRRPIVDLAYEDPEETALTATIEKRTNQITFRLKRLRSAK